MADNSDITSLEQLEAPIADAARAAQVLAAIFEQSESGSDGCHLSALEYEILVFLIYDMCTRTSELKTMFHAARDAERTARERRAAA